MPETRSDLELDNRFTRLNSVGIPSDVALETTIQKIAGNGARYAELGSALIKLAIREEENGNHTEAEAFFGKALVIGERALGSDHPALLAALTGLAATRMSQGANAHAESALTRALAICESRVEEDEPEVVILINDLVRLCLKQSQYAVAEPALLRLLAIKRTKGGDRPEVATVLASLAFVHQSLGRHQSAEQLWTRVVEIREATLAPNHLSVATALEHLADACSARGKIGQALQLLQRAQAIREVTLGKDHSSLRLSRERVADLQLQASEDCLEGDSSFTAQSPILGLGSGEIRPFAFSTLTPPAPAIRERITATHGWTTHGPVMNEPRLPLTSAAPDVKMPVREEALPALESAIAAIPQEQANTAPYREIILSMQSELEPGEDRVGLSARAAMLLASTADLFRKRDKSVEIGVAAMTLVLVAFAGSRAWGKMGAAVSDAGAERGVAATAPALAPVMNAPAPAADDSLTAAAARNLAAALNSSRSRAAEKSSPARGRSNQQSVTPVAALPKSISVNLESVVESVNAPAGDVGAAILSQQATTSTGNTPSFRSEESIPARRAMLIGAMPVPRYPAHLGPIGGEVRVRFMVDTLGRPMMPTFSVMNSPDPRLTASVKSVVPQMRFEPARTEGPDSRLTSEWVETVFRFQR